jgi:hypothetical protein
MRRMGIDKESTGIPETNVSHKTTQVNMSLVIGVLLFFVIAIAIGVWASHRNGASSTPPAGPTTNR